MNEKATKNLRILCYVALFSCACWLFVLCMKTYFSIFGSTESHVHWEVPGSAYMITVFVLYTILTLAMISLCVAFVVNILRGIRDGKLFPKGNILLLRIGAVVIFFYSFLQDNLGQAFLPSTTTIDGLSNTELMLTDTPLVLTLLMLIFAQMYKIAHDLAVENELTV